MQGFNIQKIMKQAQEMQKQMQGAQAEMEKLEITGIAGGGAVTVVFNGKNEFQSIKIKKEAVNPENPESVDDETIEMLEDLISAAVKDANSQVNALVKDKFSSITGGMNIPGLF